MPATQNAASNNLMLFRTWIRMEYPRFLQSCQSPRSLTRLFTVQAIIVCPTGRANRSAPQRCRPSQRHKLAGRMVWFSLRGNEGDTEGRQDRSTQGWGKEPPTSPKQFASLAMAEPLGEPGLGRPLGANQGISEASYPHQSIAPSRNRPCLPTRSLTDSLTR